jgi:UDP-N-acetylmuramate--alanine ligase
LDFKNIHSIYFLGIGGIGMSALARYFFRQGIRVSGYDKTPTDLTEALQSEGMDIHFEDDIKQIPETVNLVIYTPAIPKELNEYQYFLESGIPFKKRAEILGELTRNKKTIAVAGTHGKTTVSALIAHLLTHSGIGCNAFLGGISKNYHTNLLTSDTSDWMVVEADEYDKSFLQLHPDIAIITSTDADHLDIYDNHENLRHTFGQYACNIKNNGILILKKGVELDASALKNKITLHYSKSIPTDYYADNIRIENEKYVFDFVTPEKIISDIISGLPGEINVENAVAAMTASRLAGVSDEALKSGLLQFEGMERRFDVKVKTQTVIYIDDYAHHPEEIRATVSSVRKMFPAKRITGIFQPHLFSRTRDFADEFARSLELLDEIILLPIYPAREKPIAGVGSEMLLDRIQKKEKMLCAKEKLISVLAKKEIQVLMTLGAGDIDQLVEPIKDYLLKTGIK